MEFKKLENKDKNFKISPFFEKVEKEKENKQWFVTSFETKIQKLNQDFLSLCELKNNLFTSWFYTKKVIKMDKHKMRIYPLNNKQSYLINTENDYYLLLNPKTKIKHFNFQDFKTILEGNDCAFQFSYYRSPFSHNSKIGIYFIVSIEKRY